MGKDNITIKEMADSDKPREKMLTNGRKALSNSELLAIIIGSGSQKTNVLELSKRLLKDADNSLVELSKKGIAELKKEDGIGDAKAVSIVAALELGSRMWAEKRNGNDDVVKDSRSIYNIISGDLNQLAHEEFWALYLSNANKLITKRKIASGGLTATAVDVRMVLKTALENNAVGIALAHNHPSGSVKPSKQDIELTKTIKEAAKIMDIRVLDHIIIGEHFSAGNVNYYSFFDEGIL